jgi:hypothetical protein
MYMYVYSMRKRDSHTTTGQALYTDKYSNNA